MVIFQILMVRFYSCIVCRFGDFRFLVLVGFVYLYSFLLGCLFIEFVCYR